jgi:pseudo-response regulator 7
MEQPQPPAQAAQPVCWEQFLHKKTITVLLVENDDSTREVVTRLLRTCMYKGPA